jgi:hypothetical protein
MVTAFLAGVAFLVAYIFEVFKVKTGVAIQPVELVTAGLFFLTLYVAGVEDKVRARRKA